MKQVKIPESLFTDLVLYHLCHFPEPEERIIRGLNEKMDAVFRRDDYTRYKTAEDEAEREKARQSYLDRVGVPQDFRW